METYTSVLQKLVSLDDEPTYKDERIYVTASLLAILYLITQLLYTRARRREPFCDQRFSPAPHTHIGWPHAYRLASHSGRKYVPSIAYQIDVNKLSPPSHALCVVFRNNLIGHAEI